MVVYPLHCPWIEAVEVELTVDICSVDWRWTKLINTCDNPGLGPKIQNLDNKK
jgi:hypothetical protein